MGTVRWFDKPCETCSAIMTMAAPSRRFCNDCAKDRARAANKRNSTTYQSLARAFVSAAVKKGHLPRLSDSFVKCVDCGARAVQYDHRDYAQPLAVAPVCRSCNMRRGPGLNDGRLRSPFAQPNAETARAL